MAAGPPRPAGLGFSCSAFCWRRRCRQSPGTRARDAGRERGIDSLQIAFGQGRLAMDEFLARADRALGSRTHGELAAITLSIPRPREAGSAAVWTQPKTGSD